MSDLNAIYTNRINLVVEYVNQHLQEPISLEDLAKVACFSSFHFHRIFVAITGETVNSYTNRLRVEKAARLLTYSGNSVADIGSASGFSSPSTFSRSFKQYFGTTPSAYRRNGKIKNSKIRKVLFPIDQHIVPMSVEQLRSRFPVEIKEIPERRVAFIRVVNAYQEGLVLRAFERLVSWAKDRDLFESGTIFGMSLNDPMVTPRHKYRYEVCLTIPDSLDVGPQSEISFMNMPSCKFATTRVSGDLSTVATATHYLFDHWLINSAYEPEHLQALEIFTDKENVCNWSHFELELCIPVKPLQFSYSHDKK